MEPWENDRGGGNGKKPDGWRRKPGLCRRLAKSEVFRGDEGLTPEQCQRSPTTKSVRRFPNVVMISPDGRVRKCTDADEKWPDEVG